MYQMGVQTGLLCAHTLSHKALFISSYETHKQHIVPLCEKNTLCHYVTIRFLKKIHILGEGYNKPTIPLATDFSVFWSNCLAQQINQFKHKRHLATF